MKSRIIIAVVAALMVAVSWAGAEEIAGLPLHLRSSTPGRSGSGSATHASTTSIVAFATDKGIVVVDTFGVPEVDTQLREVIARELGRSDFRVLINTHEHGDHTGGNSAYADCTIVGHERIAPGLEEAAGTPRPAARVVPRLDRRVGGGARERT